MFTLNCKGRLLAFDEPIIMGILNTTPDSFYTGSRVNDVDAILFRVEEMLSEGATIIDIGGQSTRPQSKRLPANEELARVIPHIEAVSKRFPEAIISIDSFYAAVVIEATAAGASIVNDVSAGTIDNRMFATVADLKLPYVLMHMQGDPQSMQKDPRYENVTVEVFDFLNVRLRQLQELGVNDIIIDPGFGFGKTAAHNFRLLQTLDFFKELERPLLVGISRKATVYKTLGIKAEEALNGTTILNTIALLNGANILRVHDVRAAKEAIILTKEVKQAKSGT